MNVITGSKAINSQKTNRRDYKTQNLFSEKTSKSSEPLGEFPGGIVVRIPGFHGLGLGSVPGQETEIPVRHLS